MIVMVPNNCRGDPVLRDLVCDPAKNFVLDMKDGKTCKNTIKQPTIQEQTKCAERNN